jgi:hypothetical protein
MRLTKIGRKTRTPNKNFILMDYLSTGDKIYREDIERMTYTAVDKVVERYAKKMGFGIKKVNNIYWKKVPLV